MRATVFIVVIPLFIFSAAQVDASLITVSEQRNVQINVLSSEDAIALEIPERDFLEVKQVEGNFAAGNSKITLNRSGGEVRLRVDTGTSEREFDVTNVKDDIIEIEERLRPKTIRIGVDGEQFSIEQNNYTATTTFPINVDPESAELSVSTPSGRRFISVLPQEVIGNLVKAQVINILPQEGKFTLTEDERGELLYIVNGSKVINVFNVLDYPVDVEAHVSASTGEIVKVNQPPWVKVVDFLLA